MKRLLPGSIVLLVAAAFAAGGASAHGAALGGFSSGSAQAAAGFVVNASFAEAGLLPGKPVVIRTSAHVVLGYACGGKSFSASFGNVTSKIAGTSTGAGGFSGQFAIKAPSTPSCPKGQAPKFVKLLVRSIKVDDFKHRHHLDIHGWFASKATKGITAQHPLHGA